MRLPSRTPARREFLRIDRLAVDAGLVVQMRAGRTPGRTDPADDFADAHGLAYFHVDLGEMAVAGGQAIAVIDLNHVAIAAFAAGDAHSAGGGSVHRFSGFAAQVDAGVNGGPAQERVQTHAERRTHVDLTGHRLAHRHGDQPLRILVDLGARDINAVELAIESAGARTRRL